MEVKKFTGLSQRKSSKSGEDLHQLWICIKLQLSISWQIQTTQIIAVWIIHESFKSRQRHHHTCLRLLTAFTLALCFNRSIRICFPWHSQKESSSASCPSIFQDGEPRSPNTISRFRIYEKIYAGESSTNRSFTSSFILERDSCILDYTAGGFAPLTGGECCWAYFKLAKRSRQVQWRRADVENRIVDKLRFLSG